MSKRIIECSPLLRRAAKITALSISFPALDIAINWIPSDYAGAAGGNENVATFDELWAFSTEHENGFSTKRSRRRRARSPAG